jgi:dTDP-D-glucose 4,6-dehydratase
MIDINSLSKSEILELERQIQEYKKTEKFLTGYKVTFCVKFNPETHKDDSLGDAESFGDWLCDVIPKEIIGSFNLKRPEDVSGFDVVEMTEDDKLEWSGWYY